MQEGRLVVWGSNTYGQLGLGDKETREKPKILQLSPGVRAVQAAAGDRHTLVLSSTSQLYVFGSGKEGQIAPDYVDHLVPYEEKLLSGVPIRQIACGSYHNLVLSWAGVLFSWGGNNHGQLGHGDTITRTRPEHVRGVTQLVHMDAGVIGQPCRCP